MSRSAKILSKIPNCAFVRHKIQKSLNVKSGLDSILPSIDLTICSASITSELQTVTLTGGPSSPLAPLALEKPLYLTLSEAPIISLQIPTILSVDLKLSVNSISETSSNMSVNSKILSMLALINP